MWTPILKADGHHTASDVCNHIKFETQCFSNNFFSKVAAGNYDSVKRYSRNVQPILQFGVPSHSFPSLFNIK